MIYISLTALQIKKDIKQSRIRVTSKASVLFILFTVVCVSQNIQTKVFSFIIEFWNDAILRKVMRIRDFSILFFLKVVDLINNSRPEVRPTVLVSATAVGYYGTFLAQNFELCFCYCVFFS